MALIMRELQDIEKCLHMIDEVLQTREQQSYEFENAHVAAMVQLMIAPIAVIFTIDVQVCGKELYVIPRP